MADDIATLFHESAGPSMALDPYAVLAGGRRRRRRRRAAAGSAGAALAVAAAVVATGLAGVDRAAPVPADRTGLPGHPVSATLGADTPFRDSDGKRIPGPSRFVVTVDPSVTSDANLGYYTVDASGRRTLLARSAVPGPGPGSADAGAPPVTWGTGSAAPHVLIGVLPANATQFAMVAPEATGGASGDNAPLGGTGLQAFVEVYDKATDPGKVTGIVWTDGSGRVWDQEGRLPATPLGGAVVGFVDAGQSVWGSFTRDGSAMAPLGTGDRLHFSVSSSEPGGAARLVGLVPSGATRPSVHFAPGCTHRTGPALLDAGDGQHAFLVATCRPGGAAGPPMTGYSVRLGARTLTTR